MKNENWNNVAQCQKYSNLWPIRLEKSLLWKKDIKKQTINLVVRGKFFEQTQCRKHSKLLEQRLKNLHQSFSIKNNGEFFEIQDSENGFPQQKFSNNHCLCNKIFRITLKDIF